MVIKSPYILKLFWPLYQLPRVSVTWQKYTKCGQPAFHQQTFFFLVLRTWKGSICCFSVSQATASESMTQDVTESFKTYVKEECSIAS